MNTYSGRFYPTEAPTLHDVAVGLSREGRYAGAGIKWWPVLLHTFVVCDLLPDPLKIHGLLHDAPECITGDIPKPLKTDAMEKTEREIFVRIYAEFGVPLPTEAEFSEVKRADYRAFCGEVYTVGTAILRNEHPADDEAEFLVEHYAERYPPTDCLEPHGRAVQEFIQRYWDYVKLSH